jgi:hypothetical protein
MPALFPTCCSAQDNNQDAGLVQVCLYFCAQMLYSLIEYLTKLATVFMAITGEAFLTAGPHAPGVEYRLCLVFVRWDHLSVAS